MTKRGYKASGTAKSSHVEPPMDISRDLTETYGSLRHGAETAVEWWPTVRGSFDYLTDTNDKNCPFKEDELAELCDIVRPMSRLTRDLFGMLDPRFAEVLGNAYASLSDLERVCIIDAMMVKAHAGVFDGGRS